MYITHLAALSSLALSRAYNVHTQPPFQAPETRRGTIQTPAGGHALALARLYVIYIYTHVYITHVYLHI